MCFNFRSEPCACNDQALCSLSPRSQVVAFCRLWNKNIASSAKLASEVLEGAANLRAYSLANQLLIMNFFMHL
jgi:hypothetical protein